MPEMTTGFEITAVDIIDETNVAVIKYDIFYASHIWHRSTRVDLNHENLNNFTYEDLRKRVRAEAMRLINKRAPLENNINRLKKMIGQRRSF